MVLRLLLQSFDEIFFRTLIKGSYKVGISGKCYRSLSKKEESFSLHGNTSKININTLIFRAKDKKLIL